MKKNRKYVGIIFFDIRVHFEISLFEIKLFQLYNMYP